jgi:hypothetical protein
MKPMFRHELFLEWRAPRRGVSNPDPMDNPVWEWLVRTRQNAYTASKMLKGPSSIDAGPGWCFDRFGQSETMLPDGRRILVAGEHEDYYDPDFYIYNDVVVEHPGGAISIYGYPPDCFPPTDFHTATLINSGIIIIGNLGYPENRKEKTSDLYILDVESFVFRHVQTSGDQPPWIHRHKASLSEDGKLLITGGKLDRGEGRSLIENIDDWQLDLNTWNWQCVKRRNWQRWEISRADKSSNRIWKIRQTFWESSVGWKNDYHKSIEQLADDLGASPEVKSIEALYSPEVFHDPVPAIAEEYGVYRITVEGVTVRYVEDSFTIQVTIEGDLPELTIRHLVEDVRKKLAKLENTEFSAERIG